MNVLRIDEHTGTHFGVPFHFLNRKIRLKDQGIRYRYSWCVWTLEWMKDLRPAKLSIERERYHLENLTNLSKLPQKAFT